MYILDMYVYINDINVWYVINITQAWEFLVIFRIL